MAEKSKPGFVVLLDFYEPLQCLTDAQKGQVFDACFAYHLGRDPVLNDPLVKMAFSFIKPFFDKQCEAYARKCEQNRANAKRKYEQKRTDSTASDGMRTDANGCDGYQVKVKSKSEIESIKEENTSYSCQNPDFDAPGDEQETPHEDLFPRCPQEKILALYREILPELPQPRTIRGNVAVMVRARWSEKFRERGFKTEEEGLSYFRNLFTYISGNDFLTGRKNSGGRSWRCDYAWIMKAANFDKITNGYYGEAS
jgi:hypothetical protein